MPTSFAPLDDVLIERVFQPFSDAVTHRVGLNRSTAACFCLDAASFAWIVSRAPGLSDAVSRWKAGLAFLDLSLLLLGLIATMSLRILFRRAGRKQANPLRQMMRPHRAVLLLMLVVRLAALRAPGLADWADVAMLSCAGLALYLGACAEQPPLRRELASLAAART